MARFGLVMGAVIWILYAMFVTQSQRRGGASGALARLRAKPVRAAETGPVSLLVDEHGVTIIQPDATWTQAWSRFARVVELPECVVVEHSEFDHSLVIPHVAFASATAKDDFAREARRLHDASGHGELNRLRADIDATGYSCSACGYMLKGCPGVVCPECNRRVTIGAIRAATVLRVPVWRQVLRPNQRFA